MQQSHDRRKRTVGMPRAIGLLWSEGRSHETSISGSCRCGGTVVQRASRQRRLTIVSGARSRKSLHRDLILHPVGNFGAGSLALARAVLVGGARALP